MQMIKCQKNETKATGLGPNSSEEDSHHKTLLDIKICNFESPILAKGKKYSNFSTEQKKYIS